MTADPAIILKEYETLVRHVELTKLFQSQCCGCRGVCLVLTSLGFECSVTFVSSRRVSHLRSSHVGDIELKCSIVSMVINYYDYFLTVSDEASGHPRRYLCY